MIGIVLVSLLTLGLFVFGTRLVADNWYDTWVALGITAIIVILCLGLSLLWVLVL